MEYLHNGFTLEICPGGFPLSTDSIALSGFVKIPRQGRILDLGAGCGTIGLLLCARDPDCLVVGVEQDVQAHNMALTNAERNDVAARLTSICGDLTAISEILPAGTFHCCVSNPPYFPSGPASRELPQARQEQTCTLEEIFAAAAWGLKYGGDFYIVHRPERLAELCACAVNHKLEPKRLCLLRHQKDGPVTLVLVQCRKGGKPGLIWEEQALHDAQGNPTDYYRRLYHL